MWIRGQSLAVDFLTEVAELVFSDAAFKIGAGINAGRRVALDVHQIAEEFFVGGAKKMIETDVVKRRSGGEAGDVAAQFG